jgi:preprotein translocase subunit YajC
MNVAGLIRPFQFFKTPQDAMTKLHVLLAQAPTVAPASGLDMFKGMLPMILLFGAMYFLLIAPQRKKQKAHEKMLTELKSGDEVVTTGGIYGTITSVKDDRFIVRIGDNNAKIEVGKGFISSVIKKSDAS